MAAVIAVCLGLAAAASFGVASVLEERSTKQVPERAALSPRLLVDLVRRPLFLISIGVNVAGCGLQILALHYGSLTLVQPLLVLSLLFAVVLAGFGIRRQPPDAVLLAGVTCCAAGIAGFLAVARPHGGAGTAGPAATLPLAAGLAVVLAGCLAAARWGPRAARPLWLALGCGADFGVNALLLKIVPGTLPAGFADPLRQWPLYLMVIVIPVGFLLNQNAFQAGTLIAPALAVITTTDPLVSIGVGAVFLHEKIAAAPLDLAVEGLSLAVTIGGIIALAQRAPQAAQVLETPRAAALQSQAVLLVTTLPARRSRGPGGGARAEPPLVAGPVRVEGPYHPPARDLLAADEEARLAVLAELALRYLAADGLNLAGIRRVLRLQEETHRLQAELAALRELAAGNGQPGRDAPAES